MVVEGGLQGRERSVHLNLVLKVIKQPEKPGMIENDKIHGSKNIFLSIHEWRSSCIICFKKEVHCSTIIGKGLLLEFYKKDSASQAAHDYDKTRNRALRDGEAFL